MFGFKVISKDRYYKLINQLEQVSAKVNKLTDMEKILEKQEHYIDTMMDVKFETKLLPKVMIEIAEVNNTRYRLKQEYDFIKLTLLELLEVISKTDIVKNDKKLVKSFEAVIKNINEHTLILKGNAEVEKFREGKIWVVAVLVEIVVGI